MDRETVATRDSRTSEMKTERARGLCILVAGLLAFALAAASTVVRGLPLPTNHDEYSYLLAAETFAGGRLANPPHPHWWHFERFHVLQQPTRASKYPAGQGLLLAAGQIAGHPIVGVWLGIGALGAAVTWLLLAFFGPRWSLAGGLLTAILFGLPNYWALSYWGGSVAAVGGTLVFGSLPRLLRPDGRESGSVAAALCALGLVLLALSRPFEGLVFAAVCGLVLAVGLFRLERRVGRLLRWTLAAAPVLALGATWILLHNQAVTGDPLRMPHQVYQEQYANLPPFVWMSPGEPPELRHLVLVRAYAQSRSRFESLESFDRLLEANLRRIQRTADFFGTWTLLIPLLAGIVAARRRWVLFVLGLSLIYALLFFGYPGYHPHYAAPLTGALIFLYVAGLRRLARRVPPGTARALALGAFLLLVAAERTLVYEDDYLALADEKTAPEVQSLLEKRLALEGGRHLILVRLGMDADIYDEWIANGADLDSQAVIWAHDMGAARNGLLLEHYAGRHVWRLVVGTDPRRAELRKVRDALGPGGLSSE